MAKNYNEKWYTIESADLHIRVIGPSIEPQIYNSKECEWIKRARVNTAIKDICTHKFCPKAPVFEITFRDEQHGWMTITRCDEHFIKFIKEWASARYIEG